MASLIEAATTSTSDSLVSDEQSNDKSQSDTDEKVDAEEQSETIENILNNEKQIEKTSITTTLNENTKNMFKHFYKFKRKFDNFFQTFTGHSSDCVNSFNNFVELMYQPTDAASLGIGRMLFGIMMLIDIPEERSSGNLANKWGNPNECHFPLFHFLKPFIFSKMCLIYLIMWLGALGITLGYKFRTSCFMFVLSYWFVFILDKSYWNNHSYLYGLISILFLGTNANRFCSIDAILNKENNKEVVPFWNYFIIKYQFFILYFVAGLKKMSTEWLSGYAMTQLGNHWVFAPFRLFLSSEMTDLLIIHWFAWIFDLTVAFWLIYKPSRPFATIFAMAFHLMNSQLFLIGMFPWVCLVELPLFYNVSWPRILWRKITFQKEIIIIKDKKQIKTNDDENESKNTKTPLKIGVKEKTVTCVLLLHCLLQLFLPHSHFITKGYNNWTNGIYGYSWDMMVHSWDTVLISIRVVDNNNNRIHFLDPYAYTKNDRWTTHADMSYQYAHCIKHKLNNDFLNNKRTQLSSNNLSIYFDVWSSLNGRFQQRIFNPSIDILKAKWSPFNTASWLLPLLTQYTNMRYYIDNVTNTINNNTDVLFIADYPELCLENYISKELINISLTVIQGTVRYKTENGLIDKVLHKGDFIEIQSELFHKIYTISKQPSCYMYTYINETLINNNNNNINTINENKQKKILPIREEFFKHLYNYKQFFIHLGNSMLYEIYGVPMPNYNN